MNASLHVPFLSGVEMSSTLLSMLVAFIAVGVNSGNITIRVARLFFVTSFIAFTCFRAVSLLYTHLYYYWPYYELNTLFQNQLYPHEHRLPYNFWEAWINLGTVVSFIVYRRDQ